MREREGGREEKGNGGREGESTCMYLVEVAVIRRRRYTVVE